MLNANEETVKEGVKNICDNKIVDKHKFRKCDPQLDDRDTEVTTRGIVVNETSDKTVEIRTNAYQTL